MVDLIVFIGESLLTTLTTIISLVLIFVFATYLIGALTLLIWSLKVGIFKSSLIWLNPIKLIEYSGVITTVSTPDGDYIINYQGLFPRCRFVTK